MEVKPLTTGLLQDSADSCCIGLEGGAEPIAPLDEDEVFTGSSAKVVGESITKEAVASLKSEVKAPGMSFTFKLFLVACIIAACWMFVQAHGGRRGSVAGQGGFAEKGKSLA